MSPSTRIPIRHAREHGADVRQRHRAERLCLGGPVKQVSGSSPEGMFVVRSRFVVDAAGSRQLARRHLGLATTVEGPPRLARSLYVTDAGRPWQGHPNDIVTEACADGRMWFIPLGPRRTSVGFVTDADLRTDTARSPLDHQVGSTVVIRRLLESATAAGSVRTHHYCSDVVEDQLWQSGMVLVGDAAAFVDPLFSTGVHSALHGATLCSG